MVIKLSKSINKKLSKDDRSGSVIGLTKIFPLYTLNSGKMFKQELYILGQTSRVKLSMMKVVKKKWKILRGAL